MQPCTRSAEDIAVAVFLGRCDADCRVVDGDTALGNLGDEGVGRMPWVRPSAMPWQSTSRQRSQHNNRASKEVQLQRQHVKVFLNEDLFRLAAVPIRRRRRCDIATT
jgi:hypothetical protein